MNKLKVMPKASKNIKRIGRSDVNGWGDALQVNVRDTKCCYLAASGMEGHEGTSILDVEDPINPKVVNQIEAPTGTHSAQGFIPG
jgi:hypothetical protein